MPLSKFGLLVSNRFPLNELGLGIDQWLMYFLSVTQTAWWIRSSETGPLYQKKKFSNSLRFFSVWDPMQDSLNRLFTVSGVNDNLKFSRNCYNFHISILWIFPSSKKLQSIAIAITARNKHGSWQLTWSINSRCSGNSNKFCVQHLQLNFQIKPESVYTTKTDISLLRWERNWTLEKSRT